MKKCVTVLLAAALLCLIWVPVWAVEADEDGIYDISSEEVITSLRTAEGAAAASVADEDFGTYYPGAARFNVVCSGTDIGKDYTVFVVAGDEEPNSTNLVYIDQKTAAGGTVTFDVYPALKRGDYSVYVTGGSAVLSTTSPLATFSYNVITYYNVTVRVTGADASGLQVDLVRKSVPVAGVTPTVAQGAATYAYTQLRSGPFTATVAKEDYVKYTKSFTLTEDTAITVPLVAKGNVNGTQNGLGEDTSPEDMQCLYKYLSVGTKEGYITDSAYFEQVCDVNEDGSVNILDYQALYEYIRSLQDPA